MLSRTLRALSLCAVLASLASGCSGQRTSLQLVGARYAEQTPGYAAATLASSNQNLYFDNNGAPVSNVRQWSFRTDDRLVDVVAFYERELRGAIKNVETDGDITFRYKPEGAKPRESVLVRLKPGEIWITEEVLPQ